MLKTTRWFFRMLACRNCVLMSCGVCHCAFRASAYQASSGPLASAYWGADSQNCRNVRFAITRIGEIIRRSHSGIKIVGVGEVEKVLTPNAEHQARRAAEARDE